MAELVRYQELLEKTVHLISGSEETYQEFLRTSAWNFKYGLTDRILIFAQKPEAIACAERSVWESEKVGRIIKKDALGIAILKDNQVSYLYDVGDTVTFHEKNPFSLWEYDEKIEAAVVSLFKQVEPELFDNIEKMWDGISVLIQEKVRSIEEYYMDDLYMLEDVPEENRELFRSRVHDYVCASVSFMVSERMGIPFEGELKFAEKKALFQSEEGFFISLAIESAASEELLREIGALIKRVITKPEIEKVKREDYYGYNQIQEGRENFRAGFTDGGSSQLREVRTNEVGLSEEFTTGQVSGLSDGGEPLSTPGGDGHESEGVRGETGERTSENESGTGSERHAGMDGTHEQFETDGGGSNVSDSDFPLSESCGRRLSNEEIGFILSSDQFLTHSNEEISAVLLDDTADFDVKKEYLISAYDEYFCSLLYPYDENIEYVGYKKQEAGLYMWEGNFMSRTADTFYSWDEVLKHHMKELGLSIETIPAIQEDGIETIPSLDAEEKSVTYVDQKGKLWLKDDVFLVELRRGSQIEDGKYRIYNYFIEQHSAKEKADFLKDEYGIGGRTFQAGEYTSESHDSKGISFSSYSNDAPAILYTWSQVADAISKDIEAGTYLTKKEIKGLPVYENKMKIRILRNMITDYFRTYYPENRYEQEYKEIPFLSFFSSYDDSMVNMMSTFMGRTLLFESLKNMDAVSEEEQKFKKDLVAALEPLWDLEQHHYSPGWTKLDWRLEREAETALELNLNVKEDDVVYIGEKRYLIYGITDSGYILQDETFPLFTEDFTKEGLLNVLKEDLRNQEYFVEGEKIEVGHGDENRNYRLLKHVVPQLFDSNSDIDYVRYYDQNNREVVFRFHEDEDLFSVSVKDTHNENSFMQVRLAVDENEKTVIPEGFASKAGIPDEIIDRLTDEEIHEQLSRFLYFVLSGVASEKFEIEARQFSLDRDEGVMEHLEEVPSEDEEVIVDIENSVEEEEIETVDTEENVSNMEIEIMDEEVLDLRKSEKLFNPNPLQYHIVPEAFIFGGAKERFRENVAAIRTLKTIEEEGRFATAEEQEILFRYVGWGGLSSAFDEKDSSWKKEYEELKGLLTEEEYALARESTLTSFYTPPVIIEGIYQILQNLGFKNGNILDPACGTGNFFGMLPESMEGSNLYGVELDSISGRIARQLYQENSIAIEGFEKTNLPDQFFDAVIGNVPFGQFGVLDEAYKKHNFMIHDYFFAKALDKVRPGGIVAFITSKGTMDKKSTEVREYIAKRADLLGAIRLPNNTFSKNAGTTVTSDILILQKRDRVRTELPYWVHVGEDENGFTLNEYFIYHPEMVLGKLSMEKGQAGRLDLACVPDESVSFEDKFREAIGEIYGEYKPYDFDMDDLEEKIPDSIPADISIQNFGYTLIDDVVYQRRDSRMYPVETNAMALKRIKGLIPIRETLRALIQVQLDNGSDAQVTAYQNKLNALYDAFVDEFGLINSRGNSLAFSDDSSYYLLCSLECMDEEENFIGKADIFTKRTVRTKKEVLEAEDSMDALALSLGELGRVDLSYMESLLPKKTKEDILSELTGVIFLNPANENEYLTADEYLSGNVKEKLRVAKEAANEDSMFRVNVEALLTVQPKPLDATDISIRLGTTWIPDDIITEFFWDLFEVNDSYRDPDKKWSYIHVVYTPASDAWVVEGPDYGYSNVLATSTYGTERRSGKQIFEDILNLKESKVIDYYEEDGKRKSSVNKEETILAQEKQERIKEAFQEWVWKDMGRRERLVQIYNEKFNSMRPREYNGDYLLFHGMNPEISLRKHQLDAVARGIYGGNTLLDHPVGAGKTWEMVAIAMEGKRLGLSNKNLFVVPNHLLKQWASDFLLLYPAANVLVATEKDFTPENRKKFCARIATGEWDAVIIGHSQFERIPMSEEFQERVLQEEIDEISWEIARLKEEQGSHLSVKQLERTKKSLEKNLDKFHDRKRRDDVITFEELGVDRIFIDEFHFYKNLWFYTKMQNIAGISTTGAQKTSDLFMKVRYLNELTDYKGLVGATGTPITNSMAELYSLQRYFAPQVLDRLGLTSFDAWASTFGEVVTSVELAPEGTNYRTKQRFAKFYNLPELMMLYHDFADVKTPDMLNLPVPEAKFENVCVNASTEQLDILKELSERADRVRDGLVDPTDDNMLNITNDGRKLALDQRLLDKTLPDNPDSKVNACVDKLYEIWEKNKKEQLTQLVFCDLSTPAGKKKETIVMEEKDGKAEMAGLEIPFDNVYEDMRRKLIQKGVPEKEIAFIHDANTTKRKEQLFANVRSGKVRILMGSTSKMGVGTNVQDKVVALHDLDCPWRPSDLEQRLGRGIRQGNLNKEVGVFRYITESTFDAYSYQLVEQKQRFISQIRNGSVNVRSADDIDESTLAFAEIKALAAGNPLIKEKMDLDVQVHKLNLLKAEYQRNQHVLEGNVAKHYPARIANCKIKIRNLEQDILDFEGYQEKPFSIVLGGSVYTDEKSAGKALEEIFKNEKQYEKVKIGSLCGFDIFLSYSAYAKEHTLYLAGNGTYEVDTFKGGTRNLEEMKKVLNRFPAMLNDVKERLHDTEKDLEKAELELTKEFAYTEELQTKNKRLTELNILLNVEGGAGKEDLLKDARNPETSAELLSKLREHESVEIREAVAANPTTELADLMFLKEDSEEKVQIAAYLNPNMPEEEVREFCKKASEEMLSQILDGPHMKEKPLSIILERVEPQSNLAYRLAKHKKMTPELLDVLARKGSKYLHHSILERNDLLPETVEFIGSNCEDDWYNSSLVAAHPKCSEERMLSYIGKSLVEDKLLENPSITNRVLEELAERGGWSTKRAAKEILFERKKQEEALKEVSKSSLDGKIQRASGVCSNEKAAILNAKVERE